MSTTATETTANANANEKVEKVTSTVGSLTLTPAIKEGDKGPSYPRYLPHFDASEKFPPTPIRDFTDPGLRADPSKPNLLSTATSIRQLSPFLGTELRGVQLSLLSPAALDELALFVAERKVVVFREQEFKDLGPDKQIELAKHFGPIQVHPTSGNVKGFPEFHVVYRDANHNRFREYRGENRLSKTSWHSDVSYEKQPPGTTLFWILDIPENNGGDTLFLSQVEAYKRLSPAFQDRLSGLRAVHSAVEQAEYSRKRGGPVRREPVESDHPVVRVHPVTGEKALYVNRGFTRRIVGFKDEESEYLLKFLFDHIEKGSDFQVRAPYEPGTVVVWDNRVTVHSATGDFPDDQRRHAVRLTPQAEVPIPA